MSLLGIRVLLIGPNSFVIIVLSEYSARFICCAEFILVKNSLKDKLGEVIGKELVPPKNMPWIVSIPRFPV